MAWHLPDHYRLLHSTTPGYGKGVLEHGNHGIKEAYIEHQ